MPNPCDGSIITDIWDWIWKNDDVDEKEHFRLLAENEFEVCANVLV